MLPMRGRQTLEEPDVRRRAGELDVAHALTTDLGQRDFDAALVADHALVLHPLVLAAQAFPVRDGPKILAKKRPSRSGLKVR